MKVEAKKNPDTGLIEIFIGNKKFGAFDRFDDEYRYFRCNTHELTGHMLIGIGVKLNRFNTEPVLNKCPNTIDAFGDAPSVVCPSCGDVQEDMDGFGFLHCDKCGYCEHPSMDDSSGKVRCGMCGKTELEIENAKKSN